MNCLRLMIIRHCCLVSLNGGFALAVGVSVQFHVSADFVGISNR